MNRVPQRTQTVILLRHGQSTANAAGIFTGWDDVPLTAAGQAEARDAAQLMNAALLVPDTLHTSLLHRAIDTANLLTAGLGRGPLPVRRSWRLNERHYGALTGRSKSDVRTEVGDELFTAWRRSWDVRPPAGSTHQWQGLRTDPRYATVPDELLPRAESLADVADRVTPYWTDVIIPELRAGRVPLVVSHGNTLRALIALLDQLSPEDVPGVNVPTGVPLRYSLDEALRPLMSGGVWLDPAAARRVAALVDREGEPMARVRGQAGEADA